MIVDKQAIRQLIRNRINNDIDWANPYWLDLIKEEFHGVPEKVIDDVYVEEMTHKVEVLRTGEARTILNDQSSLTSSNKNYFLENLLEEKLELIN